MIKIACFLLNSLLFIIIIGGAPLDKQEENVSNQTRQSRADTLAQNGVDPTSLSRIGLYELPTLGELLRLQRNASDNNATKVSQQRCDNFYASVCGPVHKMPFRVSFKNQMGRADNVISHWDLTNRQIDTELFDHLAIYEHAKGSDYHKSAIARQMMMVYNKCLDERTRAKQAGLAVEQLIKRVQKIRTEGFTYTELFVELFPHMPFLWIQKWIDKYMAIQFSIGIFYNIWPLPNWEQEVRELGRKILKAIVEDANEHRGDADLEKVPEWLTTVSIDQQIEERLDALIIMEQQMHKDDESIEKNALDTPKVSIGELRREYPHRITIDWVKFFNTLLPGHNFTKDSTIILVKNKVNGKEERLSALDFMADYIHKFGGKMGTKTMLSHYIEWILIFQHAAMSDNKIFHRIFRQHPRAANAMMSSLLVNKYFMEKDENEPYEIEGTPEERRIAQIRHNCLEQLKRFFPEYIDRMFARALDDTVEEEAKAVMDNVKLGFEQMLNQTKWLTNETDKAKAKEKLDKMGSYIGVVPAIGNPKDPEDPELTRIDARYEPFYKFEESMPYVLIVQNLLRQWRLVDLANLAQFYEIRVYDVNGYNIYHWNSMQVTGGMLRPPFMALNQPSAQTYGALGFIVGHELGHSFDAYGYEYNAQGVKDDKWWSKESKDIFMKRKQCFDDQYSAYEMAFEGTGLKVNGTRTLFENVADNAGVRSSYIALKKQLAKLSTAKRRKETQRAIELLQLDEKFNIDQLYFLSYAYSWCGRTTREKMEKYVKRDPHSPREVRVNLPLANFPEFARAFKCQTGTRMNPAKRCILWGDGEEAEEEERH